MVLDWPSAYLNPVANFLWCAVPLLAFIIGTSAGHRSGSSCSGSHSNRTKPTAATGIFVTLDIDSLNYPSFLLFPISPVPNDQTSSIASPRRSVDSIYWDNSTWLGPGKRFAKKDINEEPSVVKSKHTAAAEHTPAKRRIGKVQWNGPKTCAIYQHWRVGSLQAKQIGAGPISWKEYVEKLNVTGSPAGTPDNNDHLTTGSQ